MASAKKNNRPEMISRIDLDPTLIYTSSSLIIYKRKCKEKTYERTYFYFAFTLRYYLLSLIGSRIPLTSIVLRLARIQPPLLDAPCAALQRRRLRGALFE